MTAPEAEAAYLRSHLANWSGKGYAVYNPHNKPLEELPIITISASSKARGRIATSCFRSFIRTDTRWTSFLRAI